MKKILSLILFFLLLFAIFSAWGGAQTVTDPQILPVATNPIRYGEALYNGTFLLVTVKIVRASSPNGISHYVMQHGATISKTIPQAAVSELPIPSEPANLILRYLFEVHTDQPPNTTAVNVEDWNRSFTYTVTAVDNAGLRSNTVRSTLLSPIRFPTELNDLFPPSAPLGLNITGVGFDFIRLSWSASSDDLSGVSHYLIRQDGAIVGTAPGTTFEATNLTPDTEYSFTVQAVDQDDRLSDLSLPAIGRTTAPVDVEPPSVPQGLAVNGAGADFIDLSWNPSTDDVSGVRNYLVRRNGTVIATPTETSYHDAGLTPQTQYSYTVQAVDNTEKLSAVSASVLAQTTPPADTLPPTMPRDLVVAAVGVDSIELAWTPSTDDVSDVQGYHVRRNGVLIATTPSNSFRDSGLAADTEYSYTVQAEDRTGKLSSLSLAVSGRTTLPPDLTPPPVPTWDAAHPPLVTQTSIRIAWNWVTDPSGIHQYNLSISDAAGTLIRVESIPGTTNTYTDALDLPPGTMRLYQVSATDGAGNESPYSDVLAAKTEDLPPLDQTPPPVPNLRTPLAQGQNSILISWDQVQDASGIDHYLLVLDRDELHPLSVLPSAGCTDPAGALCFFHDNLTAGSTHFYKVAAVDGAGNSSAYSPEKSAMTFSPPVGDTTPPTVPPKVKVHIHGRKAVVLRWKPSFDPESGVSTYRIRVTTPSGVVIHETAFLTFVERNLAPGSRTYEVSAVNGEGQASAWSKPVCIQLPPINRGPREYDGREGDRGHGCN